LKTSKIKPGQTGGTKVSRQVGRLVDGRGKNGEACNRRDINRSRGLDNTLLKIEISEVVPSLHAPKKILPQQ